MGILGKKSEIEWNYFKKKWNEIQGGGRGSGMELFGGEKGEN